MTILVIVFKERRSSGFYINFVITIVLSPFSKLICNDKCFIILIIFLSRLCFLGKERKGLFSAYPMYTTFTYSCRRCKTT
jgi:hypothetical protein